MSEEQTNQGVSQQVTSSQPFIFSDGSKVYSLNELLSKLREFDDKEFSIFVNDQKNDFSNWIINSLKNRKLGEYSTRFRTKEAFISFLDEYISFVENLKIEAPKEAKRPREEITFPPVDPEKRLAALKPAFDAAASANQDALTEAEVEEYSRNMNKIRTEVNKVFIGQKEVVDKVILALICDAHALLEGVPGLAKSLLVEVLSKVISGTDFKRIQFLPDMLPSDVIGGQIYDPKNGIFKTLKGPIFANFVLADEINRAPPKTHAALMECMQEKKVNIDVDEFILDPPFLVLATQNPLENKGTYALPEAVLDRFMFKLILQYPDREHEKVIITENATTNGGIRARVEAVLTKQYLLHVQKRVKEVYMSDAIKNYILDIVHATRGLNPKIEGVKFIQYGAGPRASIYLGIASKAQALMRGRNYVMPEDVHSVAPDILRHRVCLNFKGKAHNISPDKIVEEILMKVSTL
jgi:MoxR-like ATPase